MRRPKCSIEKGVKADDNDAYTQRERALLLGLVYLGHKGGFMEPNTGILDVSS